MKRVWHAAAMIAAGLFITAMHATAQRYTISAKPGAVNFIEGQVDLNGQPLSVKNLNATFLSANDTLSTNSGKAEVLLTPGVFLRLGDNSEIRMISPSLTDTQVELARGEAMLEVDQLGKENQITVLNHGASALVKKTGLYRFSDSPQPTVATIDGKADVALAGNRVELGKGHELVLAEPLKAQKLDTKQQDDLYAWSNTRSEYDAAASYQAAHNVNSNSYVYGYDPLYGGGFAPGWFWYPGWNTWAWLPYSGAFFSPFGWGFYSPGLIGYAPVVYTGGGGGAYWRRQPVPVNPNHPPAVGVVTTSPFSNQVARQQAARSFARSGYTTGSGQHMSAGVAASSPGTAGAARAAGSPGSFHGGASGGGSHGGGSHR